MRNKGLVGTLLLALFLFGCTEEEPLVETMWRGDDAARAGDHVLAVALYGEVADAPDGAIDDRRRAGAHVNRGNSLARLERYGEAIADYAAAIRLDPTVAEAWASRGVANDTLGKRIEAIADYRKALALKPALGEPVGFWGRLMGSAEETPTITERLAFLEKVGMGEGDEQASAELNTTATPRQRSSSGERP